MTQEKRTLNNGRTRQVMGWREWVHLPELGIEWIKAKVDTGARSSSLHAFHVVVEQDRGAAVVRFAVHPIQRETKTTIFCEAPLLEFRSVRSSNGQVSRRPVIQTLLEWDNEQWDIELTLANRDAMGFRMLLGREALRGHTLVDPGQSYVGQKPPHAIRRRKRR